MRILALTDTTRERETERTLRSLSAALHAADDAVQITDQRGVVEWANRSFLRHTGFRAEEVLGRRMEDLAAELGQGEAFEHRIRERLQRGLTWQGRLEGVRRDGRVFREDRTIAPVLDRSGTIRHFVSVSRDITERTQSEAQEQRLLTIIDATPDMVGIAGANGTVQFLNRAGRRMLGLPEDVNPSTLTIEACHPGWAYDVIRGTGVPHAIREGMWSGETALLSGDGQEIPVWQVILAHRSEEGEVTFLSTVARDLTGWKRTEGALRERVKELRTLYRVTRELARWDLPLERRLERLVPSLPEGWLHPELTRAMVRWRDRTFRTEGYRDTDWMLTTPIRSEGQVVGEIRIALLERRRNPLGGEGPFLREERQLLEAIATAIGEAVARERLQVEFVHAQRLDTIGRLAGGVAHDFNNLLAVIQGLAELVAEALPEDAEARSDLQQILRAAGRGGALTSQLLSRKQLLQEEFLQLGQVARELEPMVRRLVPEQVGLTMEFGEDPGAIRADPARLEQAVLNLVVNAVDALEGGGSIRLHSGTRELSEQEAAALPWRVEPGRYAFVAVEDDGPGMAPEVLDRAFEPFFTTKPEGVGTGLGLSMTFGFVKQSGGHLLIESHPGRGTAVHLLFPLAGGTLPEGPGEPVEEAEGGDPREAADRTILLVEDDPAVRQVLRRMLSGDGHRVLETTDGREALDVLAEGTHGIDLVISDVIMPRMGGGELARRLASRVPRIPFILMSGYDEEEITDDIREHASAFLAKPFSRNEVREAVRRAVSPPVA